MHNLRLRLLALGFVASVLFMDYSVSGQYSYIWFSTLWASLVVIRILFDTSPQLQLGSIALFLAASLFVTQWQSLNIRDVLQWVMISCVVISTHVDGIKLGWHKLNQIGGARVLQK